MTVIPRAKIAQELQMLLADTPAFLPGMPPLRSEHLTIECYRLCREGFGTGDLVIYLNTDCLSEIVSPEEVAARREVAMECLGRTATSEDGRQELERIEMRIATGAVAGHRLQFEQDLPGRKLVVEAVTDHEGVARFTGVFLQLPGRVSVAGTAVVSVASGMPAFRVVLGDKESAGTAPAARTVTCLVRLCERVPEYAAAAKEKPLVNLPVPLLLMPALILPAAGSEREGSVELFRRPDLVPDGRLVLDLRVGKTVLNPREIVCLDLIAESDGRVVGTVRIQQPERRQPVAFKLPADLAAEWQVVKHCALPALPFRFVIRGGSADGVGGAFAFEARRSGALGAALRELRASIDSRFARSAACSRGLALHLFRVVRRRHQEDCAP